MCAIHILYTCYIFIYTTCLATMGKKCAALDIVVVVLLWLPLNVGFRWRRLSARVCLNAYYLTPHTAPTTFRTNICRVYVHFVQTHEQTRDKRVRMYARTTRRGARAEAPHDIRAAPSDPRSKVKVLINRPGQPSPSLSIREAVFSRTLYDSVSERRLKGNPDQSQCPEEYVRV